jgi:hypothetical protein
MHNPLESRSESAGLVAARTFFVPGIALNQDKACCRPFRFATPRWLSFMIVFAAGCITGHAQWVQIADESFNYGAGSLTGQNGGTGWGGAWTHTYLSGASFNVSASGMSYSGLSTSGGSMVWGSGGNGISENTRAVSLQNSGVVYLQFLCQFGSSSGGGTPNIRLFNSGTLTGGVGGNGGTYGSTLSILDTSLQPASDGSSSSSASLSGLNLVITRIDYVNNNTKMWVNPDLSTFSYDTPGTADATYSGLAPAFDSLSIYSRSPGNVDELRILAQPAPEPQSISFFLMAAGATLWGRRKR